VSTLVTFDDGVATVFDAPPVTNDDDLLARADAIHAAASAKAELFVKEGLQPGLLDTLAGEIAGLRKAKDAVTLAGKRFTESTSPRSPVRRLRRRPLPTRSHRYRLLRVRDSSFSRPRSVCPAMADGSWPKKEAVMKIDPDVRGVSSFFGVDPALVQAVVAAEGDIVRAVRCSYPTVQTREEALKITARSAAHAMSDWINGVIEVSVQGGAIGAANAYALGRTYLDSVKDLQTCVTCRVTDDLAQPGQVLDLNYPAPFGEASLKIQQTTTRYEFGQPTPYDLTAETDIVRLEDVLR
jgi:hypothetical protein